MALPIVFGIYELGALLAAGGIAWYGGKAVKDTKQLLESRSQASTSQATSPAEQSSNAKETAKEKLVTEAAGCTTGTCPCARVVIISRSASPEAAQHIIDAQERFGHPKVLTLDRMSTAARRTIALKGIPIIPGMDRDEYPPATFMEGGMGASVRHIPSSDNQSAGGQLQAQMNRPTKATEGCKITIMTGP